MIGEAVNLRALASEIAAREGLAKPIGVAQVAEILGILGERWRGMSRQEAKAEFRCIRDRAGLRSEHRE